MVHPEISHGRRENRLRMVPGRFTPLLSKVLLIALAVAPLGYVAWEAAILMRNIPMWDEFETVLQFLVQYRAAHSWAEVWHPFFTMANEHCMVTSRVIVVFLYELTGKANFIHLAIIGDLFVVGVVVVFALEQQAWRERLVALALASLLLFNLQHHENLFSSYASIDHFLVVLLTTTTLALARRGGLGSLVLAGLVAVMAVFTLAHGIAVLFSVGLMVALQSRWRQLAGWLLFSGAVVAVFLWKLSSASTAFASAPTFAGATKTAVYAITLLGGVPAVGNSGLALGLGICLLGAMAWLGGRRAWHREPFLMAMAATAILSATLIGYGRARATEVSPLSSRYMVQSAVAWSSVLMIFLKSAGSTRVFNRGALGVLSFATVVSILCSLRFEAPARAFVQRRIDASRYYDFARTMVGSVSGIFPEGKRADSILSAAGRDGLFVLRPRGAAEVTMDVPLKEQKLAYYMDRIAVGPRSVHLKGWMFVEHHRSKDFVPHVMLKGGKHTYFFRGRRERRPDVVTAMKREDVLESGFYFVIPKKALPTDEFKVTLVLKDDETALYSNTDHRVRIENQGEAVTAAGGED